MQRLWQHLYLSCACNHTTLYVQVPVAEMRLLAIQQPALLVVAPYTVRYGAVLGLPMARVPPSLRSMSQA